MASRSGKIRPKMTISNRAKQFMPFAALKGLEEALASKEQVRRPKPVLSEDALAALNEKLQNIEIGQHAQFIYYEAGRILKASGSITRLHVQEQYIEFDPADESSDNDSHSADHTQSYADLFEAQNTAVGAKFPESQRIYFENLLEIKGE